jgi:hypothetical protein
MIPNLSCTTHWDHSDGPAIYKKFFLGSCIHFLVQKFLFRSNLLSSNCALVLRLGPNLSNIPRSILLKKKFPLILPLPEHKALISYLFLQIRLPSLSTELHKSSRILRTTTTNLRTSFLFSSVPSNHSFRSDNRTICWHRGRPRVQRFNNAPTKP